ncbi:uncharacterized protein F4822DRAFT_388767 [Hypoxylon trugodes]|uniref:uncharacterized protein n=1 Tax=Hypoxylon trugodes TaxID=326681 RepID=UPI00219A1B9C|nr:uncharacterized protein F4822DRAFT_388767 [Hypoxylon trugodes]KAI1391882.1 hypothetical protein F4822DRAFT_388767 [Hypoxylon trugodes]
MDSPIAKLGPEILLEIFEWLSRDRSATLVPSVLCCRKWQSLVTPVLYSDVVLTNNNIAKFAGNSPGHEVRSLTIRLDPILVDPSNPSEAKQIVESRLKVLILLGLRIPRMRPKALSISIDFATPLTASREVSSILDHLPTCCTSLEVHVSDVRHGGVIPGFTADPRTDVHLCDTIRTILPQLQHLRLHLPRLCSAIFSSGQPSQNAPRQVVRTPMLKTCIIDFSMRPPGPSSYSGAWAIPCNEDTTQILPIPPASQLPSALPPVVPVLKDFARVNSANIERFWIIDVESRDPSCPNSWAAWVRRDFMTNTSFPIPATNIGGFRLDGWLARVPSPISPNKTQDWLATPSILQSLAEGSTWVGTTSGAILPITMIREHQDILKARTRESFQKQTRISCMLWRNEDETGEKLLPKGPGKLMQQWNLSETTPNGWTRDAYHGSPMVRIPYDEV